MSKSDSQNPAQHNNQISERKIEDDKPSKSPSTNRLIRSPNLTHEQWQKLRQEWRNSMENPDQNNNSR